MGYHISYNKGDKRHFRNCKRSSAPKRWVVVGCVIFLLSAIMLGFQYAPFRNALLPGDGEVTAHAVGVLINDLRSGESVREAITAFCIEVIESAQVYR